MILVLVDQEKNIKNVVANNSEKIGISQKAILFDKSGKILVIRRSKTAPSGALYWDLPGGSLDFGENMEDGILREIKEETQLKVKSINIINAISGFDSNREFWVTICYAAEIAISEVRLSYEHDDFRWINSGELKKLKMSPRNKKFIESFLLKNVCRNNL